jgi:hypothetical protein
MKNLKIEVQGETVEDLKKALADIIDKLTEGNSSGQDSIETGSYKFVVR